MNVDFDKSCKLIVDEIDSMISGIDGKSRLSKLRSYYWTWKIPGHPQNANLHRLVGEIAQSRANANCDLDQLKDLWTITVSGIDEPILEHCKRHYVILREIKLAKE